MIRFILLLLFIGINVAHSQKLYIVPNIEAGLSYNSSENMGDFQFNKGARRGFNMDVGYMFNSHLGLFTGIGIGIYAMDYINLKGGLLLLTNQTRLENPLYLSYQTNRKQKINFFADAGIRCSYYLKGSSIEYNGDNATNGDISYNKTILMPYVHLGIKLSLPKNHWISFGIYHYFSPMDTYQSAQHTAHTNHYGIKATFGLKAITF